MTEPKKPPTKTRMQTQTERDLSGIERRQAEEIARQERENQERLTQLETSGDTTLGEFPVEVHDEFTPITAMLDEIEKQVESDRDNPRSTPIQGFTLSKDPETDRLIKAAIRVMAQHSRNSEERARKVGRQDIIDRLILNVNGLNKGYRFIRRLGYAIVSLTIASVGAIGVFISQRGEQIGEQRNRNAYYDREIDALDERVRYLERAPKPATDTRWPWPPREPREPVPPNPAPTPTPTPPP